jgi:signal transduction histidine kinase
MKERLVALDGSLEIRSIPGRGTRVEATVPLDAMRDVDVRVDATLNV